MREGDIRQRLRGTLATKGREKRHRSHSELPTVTEKHDKSGAARDKQACTTLLGGWRQGGGIVLLSQPGNAVWRVGTGSPLKEETEGSRGAVIREGRSLHKPHPKVAKTKARRSVPLV